MRLEKIDKLVRTSVLNELVIALAGVTYWKKIEKSPYCRSP